MKDQLPSLKRIEIIRDRGNVFVENKENGDYYEINEAAAYAIEQILQKMPLEQIQEQVAEKFPEEEADIYAFVEQLEALGLVHSSGHLEHETIKNGPSKRDPVWNRIPVKLAQVLFNSNSSVVYLGLLTVNILLILTIPRLVPDYMDLFIVESLGLTYVFWFVTSTVLVLFHELGHILAARAHGLSPRLGIGHRWFNLVMETDLSGVWKLPAAKRYGPYFGGVCFDQVSLLVMLTIQIIAPYSFAADIAALCVFQLTVNLIFQCCLFMKTDLYYIFENVTGSFNIMENALNKLAGKLPFLKKDRETVAFKGEEKIINVYLVILIAGSALMITLFYNYFLPQLLYVIHMARVRLVYPENTLMFLDGLAVLFFPLLMLCIVAFSYRKTWIQRKSA